MRLAAEMAYSTLERVDAKCHSPPALLLLALTVKYIPHPTLFGIFDDLVLLLAQAAGILIEQFSEVDSLLSFGPLQRSILGSG